MWRFRNPQGARRVVDPEWIAVASGKMWIPAGVPVSGPETFVVRCQPVDVVTTVVGGERVYPPEGEDQSDHDSDEGKSSQETERKRGNLHAGSIGCG